VIAAVACVLESAQGRIHQVSKFPPGIYRADEDIFMVKPEWGSKRSCPKCGERFYDLGKDEPVHCIECGNEWYPEPVLKSKQPIPFEEVKKEEVAEPDSDLADAELEDIDEEEPSADNDVDLGGDDDLGEIGGGGDEEDEH
jgi:uncharacterized protein (TIGR02300 family)